MKKRVLIGLVIVSIAIVGYFLNEDDKAKNSIEVKSENLPVTNIAIVVTNNKNILTINQKPTVDAGDDQNITFGDDVTLEAIAKDSDGEILSYLWREGNRTLSEKEHFDYKFKKGVHHLTVIVVDNNGAKVEDNVTVNVGIWVLDKIIVNNHYPSKRMFDGIINYEYNQDGKIVKTMMDFDRDGVADRIYYYGYDKEGRDTFIAFDFDNNGIIDNNISTIFYENNNIKEINNQFFNRNDGTLSNLRKEKRMEDGRLSKIIITQYRPDALSVDVAEYHYNEKNKLLKIVSISNDEKSMVEEYHYNDNSQLVEIVSIENGQNHIDEKYYYKNNKLLIEESFQNNELVFKELYIYEEEVLTKREGLYYDDGSVSDKTIKFYNKKGLLEEEIYQNGAKVKYLYDENNRLIEEERGSSKHYSFYDKDGTKIREDKYEKNENGEFENSSYTLFNEDEIEIVFFDDDGTRILNDGSKSKRHIGSVTILERRDVYDEYKNLIEIWDDSKDKLIEKRFYRFIYSKKES